MKRILSMILVLLLSFSLFCVCASADDAVSGDSAGSGQGAAPAGSTASAGQAEDAAPGYEIYDTSLFCDRIKDAFEKCHHDQKTLKILRKANWDKTDDMLRSELAACFRQYEQLQAEIDSTERSPEITRTFSTHSCRRTSRSCMKRRWKPFSAPRGKWQTVSLNCTAADYIQRQRF